MDLRILAKVHNRAKEVEQTLISLEAFKQFDKGLGGELLMVLSCDLHADLKVLTDVGLEHCSEALQGVFY